ncbi:MAG: flagellar type III secretion system pore protein FliP [Clostridiales bacterium]|jgi:flagellar biosynthetic protein FliP|nr:flagellar type III secretion system pore protein FliP [Clostridiales bacterium]
MIASEIKRFGKRMAIAILLLIFGLVLLSNVRTVSAANIGDTITGDDTTGVVPGTTNNVSGTLGPLEFRLNTAEDEGSLAATLQILLVLTVITLAPSILIMLTAFTRIIIVLHFIRSALGTQTTPPNQVLIGLALFLTFFIMSPVITQVNANAITPLSRGEITQEEAFDAGAAPIRTFMLEQTNVKDLRLFMDIAGITTVETVDEIPITVVIPSFIISELRKAFIIGFLIYIPFIIIDMVVASTLMSMGMMMLPPTMISMPFKILLFIIADGWNLVIGGLVKTFY